MTGPVSKALDDLDLAPVLGRRVTVLGSTGSVGAATLDVIRFARGHYGAHAFPLQALTAQRNVALLAAQALEFRPHRAVIGDPALRSALADALGGTGIRVDAGPEAILDAAQQPSEMVMGAIVGAAGLAPTLAAAQRGAIVALANKECVVAAGEVFRRAAQDSRGVLIPVDSEHNAAFQLLDFAEAHAIEKVTLTASGGPFRTWPLDRMAAATPEQAVSHPNWSMGAKISVDSASLMNKGLELIEAHILFGLPSSRIDVLIHPQSVIHSMVEFVDGSVLAQLGSPDMRIPIAYALSWPERIETPAQRLDLASIARLDFEKPDLERFPALRLARSALESGGAAPIVLNAANEIAVASFLAGRIRFTEIVRLVDWALANGHSGAPNSIAEVLEIDRQTRERVDAEVKASCD